MFNLSFLAKSVAALLFVWASFGAFADAEKPLAQESIFPKGAKLETLFDGGVYLTEGLSIAKDGKAYFVDITPTFLTDGELGRIWVYDPATGDTEIFRSPSGQAAGTKFAKNGDLIVTAGADFGCRCVMRIDMQTGAARLVAGKFQGRQFNAPNDLVIDRRGRIYFTDPRYIGHEEIGQPRTGVYRIDPDGSVHLVVDNLTGPNGITLSNDDSTLFVAEHYTGSNNYERLPPPKWENMSIMAYDLSDEGLVTGGRKLVDYGNAEGADGIIVDSNDNLYVTVRDINRLGVRVYNTSGELIAELPMPVKPTNLAFGRGDEANTLYITGKTGLYKIKTNAIGDYAKY